MLCAGGVVPIRFLLLGERVRLPPQVSPAPSDYRSQLFVFFLPRLLPGSSAALLASLYPNRSKELGQLLLLQG